MVGQEDDVLLQCLLVVAKAHGCPATAESLSTGLPLSVEGLTPDLLVRSAEKAGLTGRLQKLQLADIPDNICPAILMLKTGDACVLIGRGDGESVQVIYPNKVNAPVEENAASFAKKLSGYVFLARPKFHLGTASSSSLTSRPGHWFWSAFRSNASVYRDVYLAAFFINIFALAVPLFTMNVYDRVVPNAAFETLWVLALGVLLIMVGDAILKSLRGHFLDLASRRVDVELSAKIMEQTLGMRLEHRPASVGSFAVNLRSFETLRDFITSATLTTFIDLPFALLFFLVIAWIGLPILLPVILVTAVLLIYALYMRPQLERLTEKSYQAGAQRNATLIESLTGLDTLKALGAEAVMQRKWEATTRYLAGIGVEQRLATLSVVHFTGFCQQLVTVLVIITGVFLIAERELTMGGLIAATMLASRSILPFGQVVGLIGQFHQARIALRSLDSLFATPTESKKEGAFVSREFLRGDLEFKNVSFAYPGSEINSLSNVSFKIKAGEHVAILGRVGSGKSTLSKLAMGLFQPTDGAVLVDGIDLRQMDPGEYRSRVGYVPQDVTLFQGSLRDNLTLARVGISDEAMIQAVERAGLEDFVNRHPSGFDMAISERGDSVSGGQRRCIAVARAIISQPSVLLLDEPTGSMDQSTETIVKQSLSDYAAGKTMLIVTHRNSLLELVDRIIVIDGGKIVADGSKDSVISALQQGRIGKAQ
jgi:ATP-binding cassette subfamily C protein LapB